jgi:RNA polymerase primary sigma factor
MSDSVFVQVPVPLSRFFRIAVLTGVESAVRIHIDRGDDLNARDEKGQTPLMLSAARNKASICKLLLDAGADPNLLDPEGRTALNFAQIAGATDAVSVIAAASSAQTRQYEVLAEPDGIYLDDEQAMAATDSQADESADFLPSTPAESPAGVLTNEINTVPNVGLDLGVEAAEFDLTGWVAEEESSPPENDLTLSAIAFDIQSVISEHSPIDTSADWDSADDFLPERASPLLRADDAEARERLRSVLLRAIREGSIPAAQIDDLSRGEDGSPDPEAVALLSMVINDLGAETDERFEYRAPHESFEVFVAPEETLDEEGQIDDAVAFVDELTGGGNEPLRIYQREFQRKSLLTAEAEVALGQAMERGIEKALDALAAWPFGIGEVLHAVKSVESGAKPLRWLSSGPPVDPQDDEAITNGERDLESESETSSEDEGDAQVGIAYKESSDELEELLASAEILSGLPVVSNRGGSDWSACRGAVASLGLTRSFLMGLADSKLSKDAESGHAFSHAIKEYLTARDQMAVANLKLVYSIAKKYLFSGQPLDDLLQEGNIGLIRAVDRYDWRRGFKFSTYATWWIRQQVGRYVADKGKTIRLPVHVYELTQRIAQVVRAFEFQRGHAPTFEEISESVGLPIKKVLALNRLSMEPLPLHEVNNLHEHIASGVEDDYTCRDPMDIVEDMQLINAIDQLLGTIKPKDARILRMRFGIGIRDSLTLEEVGARLDVTRERIRQIEAKALRRLKNSGRLDQLRRELDGAPPPKRADCVDAPDDADDAPDGEESTVAAVEYQKPRSDKQSTPIPKGPKGSASTTIEKLLSHARAIGITVEDYPEGTDRRIWVLITETPDNRSRRVVRNLIELGFSFWPGKGYWR